MENWKKGKKEKQKRETEEKKKKKREGKNGGKKGEKQGGKKGAENDCRSAQQAIPDSTCSCGCAVLWSTHTALCPGANCVDTMRSETGITQLSQAHNPGLEPKWPQGMRQDYNVTPTTHTTTSFCKAAWRWCPSIERRTCGSRWNASISESVYS